MTDDICGVKTADGTPCQNPPSEGDHCWLDGHGGDVEPGRDSKLTKERQEIIADDIEQGASITEAANKAGIHRETFGNWMQRGQEQDEGPYAEFFERLTRAQGQGQAAYRQALMQIAIETNDTATLMSMLKQRYPDDWGDVTRSEQAGVEINVSTDAPDKDLLVDVLDGDDD